MNRNFLFIIGLAFFCLVATKIFAVPGYCKLSHRIVSQYSQELKKKKGLSLIGSGGAMMDDIKEITVHYVSLAKLTIPEARKLYVEISEEYLKRINQNKTIRPYLHNYPFKIRNLDIKISFDDEKENVRGGGYVAFIFGSKKEKVFYEKYENGELLDLHEESYDEALRIVNEEYSQETHCLNNCNH